MPKLLDFVATIAGIVKIKEPSHTLELYLTKSSFRMTLPEWNKSFRIAKTSSIRYNIVSIIGHACQMPNRGKISDELSKCFPSKNFDYEQKI